MSNQSNYFSKTRIEAFSDGVFAIILTLLVLEIKVPDIENHSSKQALFHALISLLPKVISWIVSFLIVCVIWVNHHRIFEQLQTITHGLFWFNANLLLWCSFIPFPTALMGDYLDNPIALATFGIILSLAALGFAIMRFHILQTDYVLKPEVDKSHFKTATKKSILFGPVLYLVGSAMSFLNTYIAIGIFFFIPLYFIFFNSTKTK